MALNAGLLVSGLVRGCVYTREREREPDKEREMYGTMEVRGRRLPRRVLD